MGRDAELNGQEGWSVHSYRYEQAAFYVCSFYAPPSPSFDPIMSKPDGNLVPDPDPLGLNDDDAPASGVSSASLASMSLSASSSSAEPEPGASSIGGRLLLATATPMPLRAVRRRDDDDEDDAEEDKDAGGERVERVERAEIPFDLEKHICIVVPANILKRPASIRGLVTQAVSRAVPLTPGLLAALQRTQESEERKVREEEEEDRRAPPPKPTRRIGKIVGVRAPTLATAFWTDVDFSQFSAAVGARVVRYDQLADDEKCDLLIVVGQTVGTRFTSATARDILQEGTRDVAAPAVLFALFSSSGAPGVFDVERPGIPNYEGSISFQIVTDEEPHLAVPNAAAVAKIRDVLDSR